jgi:hypothetical protein
VVRQDGRTVELRQARRLWHYYVARHEDGKAGHCSEVAAHGIDAAKSRVGCAVDVTVLDACEVLSATATAARTIQGAPALGGHKIQVKRGLAAVWPRGGDRRNSAVESGSHQESMCGYRWFTNVRLKFSQGSASNPSAPSSGPPGAAPDSRHFLEVTMRRLDNSTAQDVPLVYTVAFRRFVASLRRPGRYVANGWDYCVSVPYPQVLLDDGSHLEPWWVRAYRGRARRAALPEGQPFGTAEQLGESDADV